MDVIQTGLLELTTSYLSNWTDVVVDVPSVPPSTSLTLSLRAQYDNTESNSLGGPECAAVIYHGALQEGDLALMVGLRDSPAYEVLEISTTAFVQVVAYDGDEDGAPNWYRPYPGDEPWARYAEVVLEAERPSVDHLDISFVITADAVQAQVNELIGSMLRYDDLGLPSGHTKIHISSVYYRNGYKRSNVDALDLFALSSGGSGARFWTNFVQSFEEP
jgi:hypothetical protein